MPTTKITFRGLLLILATLPALALSACGDLSPTPYHGVPYVPERTAGTGVAYVRANMMPPKEIKAEAAVKAPMKMEEPAKLKPVAPPPPMATGDKLFDKKQSK